MDKERSFTATLWANGHPLNFLAALSGGPVWITGPLSDDVQLRDGSRALGMLDGSDEDWQHGQELGLVDFHRTVDAVPVLLYFRHSPVGYRLYVRSGNHQGEGIFCSPQGLLEAQPIGSADPACWSIQEAATGTALDARQVGDGPLDIQLASADGKPVVMQGIYPVGGYLACQASAAVSTLSLQIEARHVDWMSAD